MQELIIGICYDFDRTLSPKDMQEYGFINKLGIPAEQFWKEVSECVKKHHADNATGYMYYMVEKYRKSNLTFTKDDLRQLGKNIELFQGVTDWFKRINRFGEENGVKVEHYIISSGNKEILEASPIAKEFKEIYASSFIFDDENHPVWPAQALNYTNKTQFLFRVNKGILDVNDHTVNNTMKHEERRIPFENMIYIGDSLTDVPCMRLTVKSGGNAIGVYSSDEPNYPAMLELLNNNRINYFVEADYREDSTIDRLVKKIIISCRDRDDLRKMSAKQKETLLNLQKHSS